MPRAGEGRSIKIDPEVYEALLALKHGRMTVSDVIAQMLCDCYGWQELPAGQCELEEFTDAPDLHIRKNRMKPGDPSSAPQVLKKI